jgi:hypothetical protein
MSFFYLQDDWKVSSKLTLNLGLRYEYATPQWEDGNHLANYDLAAQKTILAKDGGIFERALVRPDRNNWAPRVGLAYSLSPKTVIRSGFGVSYVHFNRLGGENLLAYNPPTVITTTINNPVPSTAACAADVALTNCFRSTAAGYTPTMIDVSRVNLQNVSLRYTPADIRTGYVMSWHFTIQREIVKDLLFDIAYVGNRSNKLVILGDVNQARPQNPGENIALNSRRPYQAFGEMEISWGAGFSDYHALQTKLEKKFTGGFYVLNSFTYSRAIDNASGHLEVFNGDNSRVNFNNLPGEKGPGAYNQPLNSTTTLVYDLPYGRGRKFGSNSNGVLDAVFGGWRGTVINSLGSGLPVNLNYAPVTQFTVSGLPTYRPSLRGDPLAPEGARNIDNYFNTANVFIPVSAATPNPFGNAGRNTIRSYAIYQTDLGLHKDFNLGSEKRKLEYRAEFFNLFNKTNFQAPNSTASSSAFGTIRSTFPARIIQMALRLSF